MCARHKANCSLTCACISSHTRSGISTFFDSTELHSASLSSGIPALPSWLGESDRQFWSVRRYYFLLAGRQWTTKQLDGTSALVLAVCFVQSACMLTVRYHPSAHDNLQRCLHWQRRGASFSGTRDGKQQGHLSTRSGGLRRVRPLRPESQCCGW